MRGVEYACRAYNLVIKVRTKNFNPKKSIQKITTCLFGGDIKLMWPIQNILGFPILFENPV